MCNDKASLMLLIIGFMLVVSCTGPHLWIGCRDNTDYYAALSLKRLDYDESFVTVIDTHSYGDIDISHSGPFQWTAKLYDREVLVFCDSGQLNLDTDRDLCRIEQLGADSFSITWLDQ